MRFTLDELLFAEAMAFPEDVKKAFDKYLDKDDVNEMYRDFMRDRSLLRLIFKFSRADHKRGLGNQFDQIIVSLIGDYGK